MRDNNPLCEKGEIPTSEEDADIGTISLCLPKKDLALFKFL
jgi:hypothetical protein